jgi:hypothetical protein
MEFSTYELDSGFHVICHGKKDCPLYCSDPYVVFQTEAEAIAAWNTREALRTLAPNTGMREALVALADGADKCAEAPHFIVQPFLGIYREHGDVIAQARAALTPQGDRNG